MSYPDPFYAWLHAVKWKCEITILYSLVQIQIHKYFLTAYYVSDPGLQFLEMPIKGNTSYHISSAGLKLHWPSLGVLLFLSKRETCLTLAEVQVYWCWMLCKSNKYSSEVLMLIFLFFSHLASHRYHEHSGMWGGEAHCLSVPAWLMMQPVAPKEIGSDVASKIQIQESCLEAYLDLYLLIILIKQICLHAYMLRKKCTIFE